MRLIPSILILRTSALGHLYINGFTVVFQFREARYNMVSNVGAILRPLLIIILQPAVGAGSGTAR